MKLTHKLMLACAWTLAAGLVAFLIFRSAGYCWDFRVYRLVAEHTLVNGLNPYIREGWPLTYPPLALFVFRPFVFLTQENAIITWIVLKLVLFGASFYLWNKYFLKLEPKNPFIVLFFILGFNGAIFYDIASGNISGAQQFILWLGFIALLKNRPVIFSLAVLIIAQIKMDLLFFLVLLLVFDRRPHWKLFCASLAGFAALFSLNQIIFPPEYLKSYLKILASLNDYNRGVNNPSTIAFLRELVGAIHYPYPRLPIPPFAAEGLFVVFSAAILSVSGFVLFRYKSNTNTVDLKAIILFVCVLFGMLNPRVPPYMYPLLLVPCLYILTKVDHRRLSIPLAAALIMLPHPDSSFPTAVAYIFRVTSVYIQLLGVYLAWGLYVLYFRNPSASELENSAHVS